MKEGRQKKATDAEEEEAGSTVLVERVWRAKLPRLIADGTWDDYSTGLAVLLLNDPIIRWDHRCGTN